MFLDIIGFRVEVKLKLDVWENATVVDFNKSKVLFHFERQMNNFTNYFLDDGEMYTLRNLLPKTYYLIRARARNLAGYSDTSNIIFLQTNDLHVVGELLGTNSSVNGSTRPSPSSVILFTLTLLAMTIVQSCQKFLQYSAC